MDYRQIRDLLEWIERSALMSASVSIGGAHVSASKQQMPDYSHGLQMPMMGQFVAANPPAQENANAPKFSDPDETTQRQAAGHMVLSPIVGTFYASSSPDKPPLVSVGTFVKKGEVLCILEAMKIMNEITADVDGTVSQVFVENGEMVEARQPLFEIRVRD